MYRFHKFLELNHIMSKIPCSLKYIKISHVFNIIFGTKSCMLLPGNFWTVLSTQPFSNNMLYKICPQSLVKITHTLKNIFGIQSASITKIIIYEKRVLGQFMDFTNFRHRTKLLILLSILHSNNENHFINSIVVTDHIFGRKICPIIMPNLMNLPQRHSVLSHTQTLGSSYSVYRGLKSLSLIASNFRLLMTHIRDTICIKCFSDIYIDV